MNKRKNLTAVITVLTGLVLVGCTTADARLDMISMEEAKEVALKDAGVETERLVFTEAQLDTKNNKKYYDIDFIVDGVKYEYDIDALTGIVIEAERPNVKVEEESTHTQMNVEEIWEEYNKRQESIKEAEAMMQKVQEEMQKQQTLLEGTTKYSVSEEESKVIEESEIIEESTVVEENTSDFTEQRIKEIALAQVPGATINDIFEFEVDFDDGRISYEGTIIYGEMEYDFEIDGYSGAIREWEAESIYD